MKSTASYGTDCVEVGFVEFVKSTASADSISCVEVAFHTSTASATNGTCVEVGQCTCDEVLVRDSKDRDGPVLRFTGKEWDAFLAGVRAGEFDRRES